MGEARCRFHHDNQHDAHGTRLSMVALTPGDESGEIGYGSGAQTDPRKLKTGCWFGTLFIFPYIYIYIYIYILGIVIDID